MLPPGSGEPPAELGLLQWAAERAIDEQHLEQVTRAVAESRHCMFTPWHEVELVHAVQRPREAPDLQKESEIIRHPGQTQLQTTATLVPDPFSTATLTMSARWTDFVDDVSTAMPASAQDLCVFSPGETPRSWLSSLSSGDSWYCSVPARHVHASYEGKMIFYRYRPRFGIGF